MRTAFSTTVLVVFMNVGGEASPQAATDYETIMDALLRGAEYGAVLGIGWGVGVVTWIATCHQAGSFLLFKVPRAWTLWRRNILTSFLPVLKYLGGALLLLVLGTVVGRELMGLWTEGFDTGLWAGGATGLLWSINTLSTKSSQIDFLLANRRYVDESKVTLFEDEN